jgi:lipoprotein-anchoring transpeptidase ErfK/SrfK
MKQVKKFMLVFGLSLCMIMPVMADVHAEGTTPSDDTQNTTETTGDNGSTTQGENGNQTGNTEEPKTTPETPKEESKPAAKPAAKPVVKNGFINENGKIYFYKNNKRLNYKGWKKINKKIYYFNKKHAVVTGQKKIKKSYFLFNSKGKLMTGWQNVGNKRYLFKTTGKLGVIGKRLKEDKSKNVQGYKSATKWLILVDRSAHKVYVYHGKKGSWKLKKSFLCGNGKASTPTVTGTFKMGTTKGRYFKARYFDSASARCWWPTRITGGYLFHSVLYYPSSTPARVMDGRVGVGVSHGCVRLKLNNAKWIHDHITKKTTCVIYN